MARGTAQISGAEPEHSRGLDPHVSQRTAANPGSSAWVSASAGTGKTKVLTDRVLRLLLPREDGRPGTPAQKILGLTFTRAAASEMMLRISETLGAWAILPLDSGDGESLQGELLKLLGRAPSKTELEAARKLFAQVIDTPGGLKIMTIHSFCHSVLSRFPLEARLPPHFELLREHTAAKLLREAQNKVFKTAQHEKASGLHAAFIRIAETLNEKQFSDLVGSLVSERHQLAELMDRNFGIEGLHAALCTALDILPGQTSEDILLQECNDSAFDREGLQNAAGLLGTSGGKKDKLFSEAMTVWLSQPPAERVRDFESWISFFLTRDCEIQKKLAGADLLRRHPGLEETLIREAERLLDVIDRRNAAISAGLTRDLLLIGHETIREYQALKMHQGALDFDDLIFTTLDLLKGRITPVEGESAPGWVLYKLDQGIDHILIDEAQDTNPEQWKIIEALCDEFFAGQGVSGELRTVFSVGDQKQSIYSFQRASPEEFVRMKNFLSRKIAQAGQTLEDVPMNISFRSAQSVLKAVDAVFSGLPAHGGMGPDEIRHHSYRTGQAGRVEIWPLFETGKKPGKDPWELPIRIAEAPSGASKLADHIAKTIRSWLDNGEMLEARGRPVKPGDIMILVRTRNAFVNQLSRALKTHNIPVGGDDRMILSGELVIQDLMAFAAFALLPADDLTLACILKSPLVGMSEEELYTLAAGRKGTLREALGNSAHGNIYAWLEDIIRQGMEAHPYEFFSRLLQQPCPADAISGLRAVRKRLGDDILDPVEEFLGAVLDFEHNDIPSLQHFAHWQERDRVQIKREHGERSDHVRIMTVHGAKGLQAPVVILPDTVRAAFHVPGQSDRRLLWPDKTGLAFPFWTPRKSLECALYSESMKSLDARLAEEYRRLLYVAMTRAEDRLYIAGHMTLRKPLGDSWYFQIRRGLEMLPETETLEDGILRLENPQTRDVPVSSTSRKEEPAKRGLPAWLYAPAPEEPDPPAPLIPSRPGEPDPAPLSPLQAENGYRFRRGNLTHKLLQILPALAPENRKNIAGRFLERYGADLPGEIRESIIRETLDILNNGIFAPIFGPGSSAEVPVTGLTEDGRLISGQIDRLLVTDKEIRIIDYKTNRPSPENPDGIPDLYRRQMRAYAQTLRRIYPGRKIRAALLWTDGPLLMELGPGDLE